MKDLIFKGAAVAMVTPFKDNNEIDYEELNRLIDFNIENGTNAIVITGTTGESSTLSDEEHKKAIKHTVEYVNKRIPVIAGTGSNDTEYAVQLSQYAESVGVDGLLVITPYYNKTNSKGLFKHFEAINNSVNTPIIVYNVPGRTGVNITPENLVKLSSLSNVVAIKEASGNISQVAKIAAMCKDIDIYSGNDDQIIPIMSLGGKGVISVLANVIPNKVHKMTRDYLNGNVKEACNIQLNTLELTNNLFIETNPIPVKTALNLIGKEVGPLRLPLYNMDEKNENTLKETLKKYNLL